MGFLMRSGSVPLVSRTRRRRSWRSRGRRNEKRRRRPKRIRSSRKRRPNVSPPPSDVRSTMSANAPTRRGRRRPLKNAKPPTKSARKKKRRRAPRRRRREKKRRNVRRASSLPPPLRARIPWRWRQILSRGRGVLVVRPRARHWRGCKPSFSCSSNSRQPLRRRREGNSPQSNEAEAGRARTAAPPSRASSRPNPRSPRPTCTSTRPTSPWNEAAPDERSSGRCSTTRWRRAGS
mmetsp:Transcript_11649/g.24953  ORF Transcript_11649/g.24953 Transcript_11649/m.24953 type:complete len:234 (+) Transcript_11649:1183-1884(+)